MSTATLDPAELVRQSKLIPALQKAALTDGDGVCTTCHHDVFTTAGTGRCEHVHRQAQGVEPSNAPAPTHRGTGAGASENDNAPQRSGSAPGAAGPSLWFDVAGLLDHGMPEPPRPTIGRRRDGVGLFYPGQTHQLFGDPESGKTWLALATATETLNAGHSAAVLDMDHNGPEQTISRLLLLGADPAALRDPDRFRYVEPEDRPHLMAVVKDYCAWRPAFVLLDSIGELLPTLALNSNSPDDFTIANTAVMKPLAASGACVVSIDHLAKNSDSRSMGSGGTFAKKRAVGGSSLRVVVSESFTPGRGGSAYLYINKDRPGGLRRYCPVGEREPLAGLFKMTEDEQGQIRWTVLTPDDAPAPPASEGPGSRGGMTVAEGIAKLREQFPDGPPTAYRKIREALGCRNDLALEISHALKDAPAPTPPVSTGAGAGSIRICTVCGEPLMSSDPSVTIHPNCEPQEALS